MIRILIIDDHPIFRRGLAWSLEEVEGMTVCGEGASAADALTLTQALRPDVLLLDLSMPGGGLNVLRDLHRLHPDTRIAVLTASENGEDVLAAMNAGASGYILKGIGSRDLGEAVRAVAAGEGYVSPGLAARMIADMTVATTARPAQLTQREEEVLRLVSEGHSNKEIARRTGLQEKTVKHHMTRILSKLGARNRTEAAMILRSLTEGQT